MSKQSLPKQLVDPIIEISEHFTVFQTPWGKMQFDVFKPGESFDRPHAVNDFLKFYGLDKAILPHVRFHQGFFRSALGRMMAYGWFPEKPRATVLVMHGYFDHTAQLSQLITELVQANYAVVAYDMPGHGLSGGERAYISDFDHYVAVFKDFLTQFKSQLPQPLHIVAHSTGSVPIQQYLLSGGEDLFGQVIITAPLVRCTRWFLVLLICRLFRRIAEEIPRRFSKNPTNPQSIEWVKRDPLHYKKIPIAWLEALRNWQRRIQYFHKHDKPLWIFQGTKDDVVDWKYNLNFLQEKFPKSMVEYIKMAGHRLYDEESSLVSFLINNILAILDMDASTQSSEKAKQR